MEVYDSQIGNLAWNVLKQILNLTNKYYKLSDCDEILAIFLKQRAQTIGQ